MAAAAAEQTMEHVARRSPHVPLCTIELIAEGHAERCPGEACGFWSHGCVLSRVEYEIGGRPEVAALLLELRREIESGREVALADARRQLDERLVREPE